MMGNIFNIQRFSTSDGPGIRTVVFLKGCPLSCIWCHNPESKKAGADIFYNPEKCIGCKSCERLCESHRHEFHADGHIFLRDNCKGCLKCAAECPADALEICGKEMSCADVMSEILRDREFYEQSHGGITLSGGEPLFQYDFSVEVLKKSKEHGLHTAVETSGYCQRELDEIIRYVDLWLYDIKLISEEEHLKYTGVSNKKILDNLFFLDGTGAKIILRCPIIPNVNLTENHFDGIAALAGKLENLVAIHFEPYHPLGIDKAARLGTVQKYGEREFLSGDEILPFVDRVRGKIKVDIEIL